MTIVIPQPTVRGGGEFESYGELDIVAYNNTLQRALDLLPTEGSISRYNLLHVDSEFEHKLTGPHHMGSEVRMHFQLCDGYSDDLQEAILPDFDIYAKFASSGGIGTFYVTIRYSNRVIDLNEALPHYRDQNEALMAAVKLMKFRSDLKGRCIAYLLKELNKMQAEAIRAVNDTIDDPDVEQI